MADCLEMNCDGIARWYRFLEYLVFGRALERRRLQYVDEIANAQRVLILGDGDGRFTAELVKRNPLAVVESIDISRRMMALAAERVGSERVRFRVGDARTVKLLGSYDLVVTHFFLDCFGREELMALVARVSAKCEPGARWLVSEFGLPAASLGRIAAHALIRLMYFGFDVTTGLKVTQLPDYADVLERHGFLISRKRGVLGGFLASEIWERAS